MPSGLLPGDIPTAITAAIGPILRLFDSPQGMTSTVTIAETARGKVALKRAEGALYGGWLSKEYRVLSALAALTETGRRLTPAPRAFARVDTGIVSERWLAMDYLPGVTLEAVKRAEEGDDSVVRPVERLGQNQTVRLRPPVPARAAADCDLLEREQASLELSDGAVSLQVAPYEIRTIRFKLA